MLPDESKLTQQNVEAVDELLEDTFVVLWQAREKLLEQPLHYPKVDWTRILWKFKFLFMI